MRTSTHYPVNASHATLDYIVIQAADISRADKNRETLQTMLAQIPTGPVVVGIVRQHHSEALRYLAEKFDWVATARGRIGATPVRALTALVYRGALFIDEQSGLSIRTAPMDASTEVYVVGHQDDIVVFRPTRGMPAYTYQEALRTLIPSTIEG